MKLTGELDYDWRNVWGVRDQSGDLLLLNMGQIPDGDKYHFSPKIPIDVIVELHRVGENRDEFTKGVKKIRLHDNRPRFAGTKKSIRKMTFKF